MLGLMALDVVLKNGTNTGTEATPPTRRSVLRSRERGWRQDEGRLQTGFKLAAGLESNCE